MKLSQNYELGRLEKLIGGLEFKVNNQLSLFESTLNEAQSKVF